MKTQTRVVVIGGGIVGCSVLYHLTKLGWSDVVLIERRELTAGSSWHAAGGFTSMNGDLNISRLQAYTISMYQEIQALSGQDVGLHIVGGIEVAATPARWDFLRSQAARHRVLGLDTQLLGPAEIRDLCPIMDTSEILGGIYDPHEGYLDPSGATHAYAKAARLKGAEIYRQTRVVELKQTPRGSWLVVTDKGTIEADHVVNAAGLWAREVGAMAGVALPLIPMEHHYLITEDIPELVTLGREIPFTADLDGEIYLRQEHKGVLLGVYEHNPTPWAVGGTPWDYGETDLLPPDLDRLVDSLSKGFTRFPSVEAAGIRRIVNGPFTFTPDGNPLVGPVRGLKNYWAACGVMAGFSQCGGIGLSLSQWIVDGEPDGDIFAMDVARFGPYATRSYVQEKASEFYSRRMQIAYPNEVWPAGRVAKTSPIHDCLSQRNAVFGVSYGLEVPAYFAPAGEAAAERPSFYRSNAFDVVAEEVRAARNDVALLDASSFAKYEVSGPGAAAWLDWVLPCRLPKVGAIRLAPMLSHSGRLMGDLTLLRLADDRFMIFGSGYLQNWHLRWFEQHLPESGVVLTNQTDAVQGIAVIGPKSRELLRRVVRPREDIDGLGFMKAARMDVGLAPAIVARLSLSGELTYEIYVPAHYLRSVYDGLMAAGRDLGVHDIGIYALNSLRLEKGFGIWSREFSRDYTPRISGLDRFIAYDKPDFIGRDAALADRAQEPAHRLVCLEIDATTSDAWGYEPIWHRGVYAGFITSGGYGHTVRKSLAMGYLRSELIAAGDPLEVSLLGERHPARILTEPSYDPSGARMRI